MGAQAPSTTGATGLWPGRAHASHHPQVGLGVGPALGDEPTIGGAPPTHAGLQELVGRTTIYSITIGGTEVFSGTNSEPAEFENVKVYACSEWYNPLNGSIRNILIQHKNYGKPVFTLKRMYINNTFTLQKYFSRFH